MHRTLKLVAYFSIIIVMASVLGGVALAGKASPLDQVAPEQTTTAGTQNLTTYLPCVLNNSCPAVIVDSPFSLQIAALDQIPPTKINQDQYNAWVEQSFPTLVEALKNSGAKWTRIMIRWMDIEPQRGQPRNYSGYDNRLGQIAQAGVKMIATVDKPPEWAYNYGSSCPPITADHVTDYQQFLSDLVTRYSQPPYNITTWEIFNEADNTKINGTESFACFGDYVAHYSNILQTSYQTIKNIDPSATVLMSGIAYDWFTEYPNGPFYRYFPDDLMDQGGGNFMDALNFHYFPDNYAEWERWTPPATPPTCSAPADKVGTPHAAGGIDVMAKDNYFASRMNTCFGVNKPVWLTELGAHGISGDEQSLANQAYYVIKGYVRSLAAGIKNITWFALVAPPYDPYQQGLLYDDFSPKKAYFAYQTLVAQLTNYKYNRTLSITDEYGDVAGEAYVFTHSCEGEKIVAWASADVIHQSRNRVYITLSPATSVGVTDYHGNEVIVFDGAQGDEDLTQNGSIKIKLPYDPLSTEGTTLSIPLFIRTITR